MTLSEIYTNVHTQLSKDGNGGLISLPKFNTLLPSIIYELIREEAKKNSVILDHGNDQLLSLQILKNLIVIKENQDVSSIGGQPYSAILKLDAATIGFDLLYWGKMWTNTFSGATRKVDLVTIDQFVEKHTNVMKMNIEENPVAYIYLRNSDLFARIYPSSLNGSSTVNLLFIKKPTDPFLDYYIDADYKTQFLAAGGSHALLASEQYRDGTTSGTKISQTEELELAEDYHPKFQDKLIARISLPLDDQYKNQYATAKEQNS